MFFLTPRVSEGGRGEAVQRVQRRRTRSATSPVSWAKQSTRELFDGAFYIGSTTGTRSYPEGGYTAGFPFLDASRVVPTANENRPANVALPVALYIGLPA